eukprot:scaffold4482_cov393-Prasinococcus_capsulatus_cf.AAC.4
MAGMQILCSDKTGTLTKNELALDPNEVVTLDGDVKELLTIATLAARWENQDAIDRAITGALDSSPEEYVKGYVMGEFKPFNPVDKYTQCICKNPEGKARYLESG